MDPYRSDDLERDFPLGDGTAETSILVTCVHCGEAFEILLDPGGGATQEYIEDCEICCRPLQLRVRYRHDGSADVEVGSTEGE